MKTIYSDAHREHRIEVELYGSELVPCFEQPVRADSVLTQVIAVGLGPVLAPVDHGRSAITSVHAADYVEGDAFSGCAPKSDMSRRVPASIHGRLGYYSFDAGAPITAGTWKAAYAATQVALTAADLLANGEASAFALCRPPGHHASKAYLGGYCYLNNAAIAAQSLIDRGMKRAAILDVDFHHGNGTQSIFYDRSDVLFASIHGDPNEEYPYFSGHADETGTGPGAGCNVNFPLPPGTGPDRWLEALAAALSCIRAYRPDAIVVSLGVDTFEHDPISSFKLRSDDYLRLGEALRTVRLPALFVMEGGYALDAIGLNVTNTLVGFET